MTRSPLSCTLPFGDLTAVAKRFNARQNWRTPREPRFDSESDRAARFTVCQAAQANLNVFQFTKTGRYLVICMNRAHSLNDHMFGFVNVVGGDDDDQ